MRTAPPDLIAIFALLAVSAGALGLALIAQYGYGLWPCVVCYWQRVPYGLIAFLSLMALLPAVDAQSRRRVCWLCVELFILDVGLAFYHVGIEARWWSGPAECAGQVREYSTEDMLSALSQPGRLGCEEAAFRFLGISMAGYNVIFCSLFALIGALAVRKESLWTRQP